MSDLAELRRLAMEATSGPWRNGYDPCHFDAPEVTDGKTFAYYVPTGDNARFIAACSPDVAIALLDRVETSRDAIATRDATIAALRAAALRALVDGKGNP